MIEDIEFQWISVGNQHYKGTRTPHEDGRGLVLAFRVKAGGWWGYWTHVGTEDSPRLPPWRDNTEARPQDAEWGAVPLGYEESVKARG